MANTTTLDGQRVASAFVQRRSADGAKVTCSDMYTVDRDGYQWDVCGARRIYSDGRTIYSYGDHFPVAYWLDNGAGVAVTTERYEMGAWPSGKPKYSTVTPRHIRAVTDALTLAGFAPSGQEITKRHEYGRYGCREIVFDVWQRVTPAE